MQDKDKELSTRIQAIFIEYHAAPAMISGYAMLKDETFRLSDGRLLGYAEYGSCKGYPVFYFHGFPACRYEASDLHKAAKTSGVRLIAVDRPGFGLSTHQPGRRFIDWPEDIKALAAHLQISQFAILAWSGGGPYALACASALDAKMLSAIGVMACAPPWAAGRALMTRQSQITGHMSNFPTIIKITIAGFIWLGKLLCGVRSVDEKFGEGHTEHGSSSRNTFKHFRRQCARNLETFRQGTDGTFEEAAMLSARDWGFNFEVTTHEKLFFWHGAMDTRAPIGMTRWLVGKLPVAQLQEYPAEGHFDMQSHIFDIFKSITSSPQSKHHQPRTKGL